ncbi:MAG: TIM-barrel domain-containing protein [Myxococcota bacterium]
MKLLRPVPLLMLVACVGGPTSTDAAVVETPAPDGGATPDAAVPDAQSPLPDAATVDAARSDGSRGDASAADAGRTDAGAPDATVSPDAAVPDAARPDASDAGQGDAGVPVRAGCPTTSTLPAHATPSSDGWRITCDTTTVLVQPIDDGVVRLRYTGALPVTERASWAVVASGTAPPVQAGSRDGAFALCTARMGVTLDDACRLVARDEGGAVLVEDGAEGGYREDALTGRRTLTRRAELGEHFYGLGERTGPLDKRGDVYTFWNTDAYVSEYGGYPADADPLYQSIPLLISLRAGRAHGVFTDNTHRMQLDVASSAADQVTLTAWGGAVDQYLLVGPRLSDVVERYTWLTGRMPLPPRWALGYHQSRWGYPTAARVTEVMQEFRNRGIPADGIWLDIQHMDGFRSFTFDPVGYADPSGLVATVEGLGFKAVIIVDPGIKEDASWDIYQQGISGAHFLATPQGTPYVGEVWPGRALFPDFTRAATRAWWSTLIPRATTHGIRGLWIDMNEPSNFVAGSGGTVPDDLGVDGDGIPTTMAEAHNIYAHQMARASYEGLRAAAPERRPFVLSRAGYAGIQRYAAVWTGDAPSTWDTLGTTLPMLLNMGLSGLTFVGSDVGGYSGNASAELFARWMALGTISPFFRGHVTTGVNDQEPWAFGVEVEYISRTLITERYRLLPYLYSLFDQATRTGAPVLRPMVYEHQDDSATATISDAAMLGPWLLYAPVTTSSATTRSVYLPAGRWMEYRSGALHDGPGTVTLDVRLESLPAFVRPGAIIPHGPAMPHTDAPKSGPLTLDIHPADEPTSFTLYEDDGSSFAYASGAHRRVTYRTQRTALGAVVEAAVPEGTFTPAPRTLLVRVRPADHPAQGVFLDGAAVPERATLDELLTQGTGWAWDAADRGLLVAFPEQAPFALELRYDTSITALSPTVRVPLEVVVPQDTPAGSTIHVATSAQGWQHLPLTWAPGMDRAYGEVEVPRGQWFEYKYTRGAWETVEKWNGCLEATNRYAFGAAHPGKQDRVDVWRDRCE